MMHENDERKSMREIEHFAQWFHQDFTVIYPDLDEGVAAYITSLDSSRRHVLKRELEQLLCEYPGKDGKGLQNAWLRLGAQAWPRSKDLRAEIAGWLRVLV
jgi:hypothetical protein